jgi:hypothetical protein
MNSTSRRNGSTGALRFLRPLITSLPLLPLGDDSSSLLGGLLVTTIGLAAYTRADTPMAERRDFFVYIDEF